MECMPHLRTTEQAGRRSMGTSGGTLVELKGGNLGDGSLVFCQLLVHMLAGLCEKIFVSSCDGVVSLLCAYICQVGFSGQLSMAEFPRDVNRGPGNYKTPTPV